MYGSSSLSQHGNAYKYCIYGIWTSNRGDNRSCARGKGDSTDGGCYRSNSRNRSRGNRDGTGWDATDGNRNGRRHRSNSRNSNCGNRDGTDRDSGCYNNRNKKSCSAENCRRRVNSDFWWLGWWVFCWLQNDLSWQRWKWPVVRGKNSTWWFFLDIWCLCACQGRIYF